MYYFANLCSEVDSDRRPFSLFSNVGQLKQCGLICAVRFHRLVAEISENVRLYNRNVLRIHRNYAERASSEPAAD